MFLNVTCYFEKGGNKEIFFSVKVSAENCSKKLHCALSPQVNDECTKIPNQTPLKVKEKMVIYGIELVRLITQKLNISIFPLLRCKYDFKAR